MPGESDTGIYRVTKTVGGDKSLDIGDGPPFDTVDEVARRVYESDEAPQTLSLAGSVE